LKDLEHSVTLSKKY